MVDESLVVTKMAEPVHLTITRNAKGNYQWEISVHTPDADSAIEIGLALDRRLLHEYKGKMSGDAEVKKE